MLTLMNRLTVLKNFLKKITDKKNYRSVIDGTTNDKCDKLNGYITDKEYLTCIKI